MIRIVKLARWPEVLDYARMGWLPRGEILAGTPHGFWSCAVQWLCNCPMPILRRGE